MSKVAGHGSLPAVLWVGLFLVDVALIAGLEVERVKAALQDTLYTGCQLTDKEERRFFIRQNHLDNRWRVAASRNAFLCDYEARR